MRRRSSLCGDETLLVLAVIKSVVEDAIRRHSKHDRSRPGDREHCQTTAGK